MSIPRRDQGFEDIEPSQLLLLVVARAPLAVYKYLSPVNPFLFLITHPSSGLFQKRKWYNAWCALPPALLHHFLQKSSRLFSMSCASASASSSGFLQKLSRSYAMVCASSCASSSFYPKVWLRVICVVRSVLCSFIIFTKNKIGQQHGARSSCAASTSSPKRTVARSMVCSSSRGFLKHNYLPKSHQITSHVLATVLSFRKCYHHSFMSLFLEQPTTYYYGRHGCGRSREIAVEAVHCRSRNLPEKHE